MDWRCRAARRLPSHDFFARARARLALDVPAALDDHAAEGRARRPRSRSVIVGARRREGDPAGGGAHSGGRPARADGAAHLRTELPSHPGQIAFPGGKIDPDDATPAAAALREAEEEIGLAHDLIEPIGYLDLYLTFSGFRILPTVARVRPDYRLVLNEREVADAFEVPLAFLMDVQNHALHSRDWKGVAAQVLRHAVRRALHLGRDRGDLAEFVRADLSGAEASMTFDPSTEASGTQRKAKIFISYSRKDITFVDRLEGALKARGFEPQLDRTDIHAFEDWWRRIEDADRQGRHASSSRSAPTPSRPRYAKERSRSRPR